MKPSDPARWRVLRAAWLSARIWERRLILLGGSVAIGVAAVGIAWLSDGAIALQQRIVERYWWAMLVATPLGFGLAAGITRRWFDGTQGSGVPQVIAARASKDHDHRQALLSIKGAIAKIVLVAFGLLVGASIGREGPTIQIGAAIMLAVAGMAGIGRQRGLVLAGAAAGLAAAFNAPLAGILFAIEELAKSFERRISAVTAASVVIAGLVSLALVGNASYFGRVAMQFGRAEDWLAIPLCAVICGALGGVFSRGLIEATRLSGRLLGAKSWRRIGFAAGCGAIVAFLGILTDNYAAGTSYAETRRILAGEFLEWYGPLAKLLTTLLSSVSGIPGGLFSPSLAVGAGLGTIVHPLLPSVDPGTLALLAMVGYFAGVVQSPLTACVIVMEMTSSQHAAIPLLATSLLAAGISRLICREPVYHALSYGFSDPSRFEGRPNERTRTAPPESAIR